MKNVKMKLLSLALFAVVGAALAFKAKFQFDYCISNANVTANNIGKACRIHAVSKIDPANAAPFGSYH